METASSSIWQKSTAYALIALAIPLYVVYPIYLLAPQTFASAAIANPGMVFYGLATAACAFVAWGMIFIGAIRQNLSKQLIYKASAVGLGLLSLMRLFTAAWPFPPFDNLLPLLLGEALFFALVAFKLVRS